MHSIFRYITLDLEGRRVGNVIFGYASLLGIAKRNNMIPVLPKNDLIRTFFAASMKIGSVSSMNIFRHYEEFGRRACAYDIHTEHLWKQLPLEVVLHGYFQSWKYFENVKDELRDSHFVFQEHILDRAKKFFQTALPSDLQSNSVVRVGIHIRRGDMTKPDKVNFGYTVADKPYVEEAMKYFRDRFTRLVFIVVSENHQWFKQEIGDSSSIPDVIFSTQTEPAVDLAILSLCNHTIITVGSFGWWGAWLANGTTTYYNRWPRPNSVLQYTTDKAQYFPSHWIPIPP